jgi:hypothetical protein
VVVAPADGGDVQAIGTETREGVGTADGDALRGQCGPHRGAVWGPAAAGGRYLADQDPATRWAWSYPGRIAATGDRSGSAGNGQGDVAAPGAVAVRRRGSPNGVRRWFIPLELQSWSDSRRRPSRR